MKQKRALLRAADEYDTLESPFNHDYLVNLLKKYGIGRIKEYVEINRFFEKTPEVRFDLSKSFREPFDVNFLVGQREIVEREQSDSLAGWSGDI